MSEPGETGDSNALRVDFYVLEDSSPSARLKLACRLAEKAYLAAQHVLLWHDDSQELKVLDELLWTFADGSFVPHDLAATAVTEAPVVLATGAFPAGQFDMIINLSTELPPDLERTRRVAEIIDGDEARRRAGRMRFKAYRERGLQPASHNIRAAF
ncbi:MAG TPA: DNA polymerase III subunit chi [Steroidobacteraceae bacterium]|nr:DNA polymerase III subunit chi [Steroidobacteraceae bacterium]